VHEQKNKLLFVKNASKIHEKKKIPAGQHVCPTHLASLALISECHGYGYTHGFHMGLAMGTGMRLLTRQKPVPIIIMQLCHTMTQLNMAV